MKWVSKSCFSSLYFFVLYFLIQLQRISSAVPSHSKHETGTYLVFFCINPEAILNLSRHRIQLLVFRKSKLLRLSHLWVCNSFISCFVFFFACSLLIFAFPPKTSFCTGPSCIVKLFTFLALMFSFALRNPVLRKPGNVKPSWCKY